jgi:hypothetical protein
MQGSLAGRFALIAALAAVPLAASEVYVPLLNPSVANDGSRSETELWVSNVGAGTATFAATFLAADTDGTQRTGTPVSVQLPAGRSFNLAKVAQAGKAGLLAVDVGTSTGLLVEARIVSTAQTGAVTTARVPVVTDATRLAAGSKAQLLALERDPEKGRLLHFGLINLGTAAATCQVSFVRTDGSPVGNAISVPLKPLSLLHYTDALGIINAGRVSGVRAEVTCNQPFYAYGAQFGYPNSHYMFVTPAGGTSSSGGSTTPPTPPPPASGNSVVFTRAGVVHEATTSNPKGIVAVTVPQALTLKRLIIDLDVVPGPWNREKIPGNHGLIWLYRGKFRGNTVANVNSFGPNKYTVKAAQNVDLGAGDLTAAEGGLTLVQGERYHIHYVYDAANELVTATFSTGGQTVRTLTFAATSVGRVLTVPATGLTAEFGHYYGQEGPEVACPGWKYYDLRIEMIPN